MGLAAKDDSDWKQKYLDQLDEADAKEKLWIQKEELLKHGLNRVSLAADGIDTQLDRHLKKLRKILRQEDSYDDIKQSIETITDTVKNLDDDHARETQPSSATDMLGWLLDNIELPKPFSKPVTKLQHRLRKLAPDESADVIATAYCALVNEIFVDSQAESKSWLQKVFGDNNDIESDRVAPQVCNINESLYWTVGADVLDQLLQKLTVGWLDTDRSSQLREQVEKLQSKQAVTSLLDDIVHALQSGAATQDSKTKATTATSELQLVNKFCLQVLETMNFPLDLQTPASALRDRVVGGISEAEIPGVIKAIADLIITTRHRIEVEKQDLQEFLLQLSNHLTDIDLNLGGIKDLGIESDQNSEQFNRHISQEMHKLQTTVQEASDLDLLKKAVQERVKGIQDRISENQHYLFKRQQKLAQALTKSTARLKKLEQESDNLRERLKKEHAQATHDALTGLHNRLAYEQQVHMEFARWKRYKKPLSMLIFDIDYFKNINDTYGHKAGDNALRLIAKKLKASIRETDFIARYGGEEFIILMPETDLPDAIMVAEKLRLRVAEVKFSYQNTPVPITISCGAAQFETGDRIEDVFQRADQALYQAKKLGRNRCYTTPIQ